MKLEKKKPEPGDPVEFAFEVSDVKLEDIKEPSPRFQQFLRQSKTIPFVNHFTIGTFSEEVRKRFGRPPG